MKEKHPKGKGTTFTCTHYGEEGHSKLRCYEIIGCPDWWDFTKKPQKKISQDAMATSSDPKEPVTPMAAHMVTDSSMYIKNPLIIIIG